MWGGMRGEVGWDGVEMGVWGGKRGGKVMVEREGGGE